jgi:hypothetical protein
MYKNLRAEMARAGIKNADIQRAIGVSEKTVRLRLNGKSEFSYSEAAEIRDKFFPGLKIEYLFQRDGKEATQ